MKRYEEALADFNQAIGIDASRSGYFLERGRVFLRQEKNDLAITDFNQALMLDADGPDCALIHNDRGTFYFIFARLFVNFNVKSSINLHKKHFLFNFVTKNSVGVPSQG